MCVVPVFYVFSQEEGDGPRTRCRKKKWWRQTAWEIHQSGKVAVVIKNPYFFCACVNGAGTTLYFLCIAIMIEDITSCGSGLCPWNCAWTLTYMITGWRIHEHFWNKVSDVAVKISGKWGCVFVLGKNNGEMSQGFHTLLCILNVLKH